MWIVRIALRRPYTFIVAALVIVLMTPIVLQRTPTDVFPEHRHPGRERLLELRGTLPGVDVAAHRRSRTSASSRQWSTIIEHTESQTVAGRSVIKAFFHPGTDVHVAVTQITALSQTIIRQLPPGISPPLIITYSASSVPVSAIGHAGQWAFRAGIVRLRSQSRPQPTGDGCRSGHPLALWRETAPGLGEHRHPGAAGQGPVARGRDQRHFRAKPGSALRHRQNGLDRIQRGDERVARHAWRR